MKAKCPASGTSAWSIAAGAGWLRSTQRTRLATQDSLASANADVSADHVRLYKALGGGWVPDITASASPLNNNNTRAQP